jgi:hypothetical protein
MLQIIYIHIPKTAGSTMLRLFRVNYKDSEIVHVKRSLFNKNPETAPAKLLLNSIKPQTKVLHGHFTFNELHLVIDKYPDAKLITFLRQPVDRVISNYTFFKKRILTGKVEKDQKHRINEHLTTYAQLPKSRNRMHTFLDGLKLDELYFIGLVETFESDCKKLFQSLNLNIETIPFANKNMLIRASDLSVSGNEIKELEKLNQKDILLYRKVLKLRSLAS